MLYRVKVGFLVSVKSVRSRLIHSDRRHQSVRLTAAPERRCSSRTFRHGYLVTT